MRILVLGVAAPRDRNFESAIATYRARLASLWPTDLHFIGAGPPGLQESQRRAREAARLLDCLTPTDVVAALDERGQTLDSQHFAARLSQLADQGARRLVFIVGGPFGLDAAVLQRAQWNVSLSALTFPHQMVPLILLEQLYRASTIVGHRPYHH